ncbi:hypothetical protein ACJX0J_019115, partial [Zea mays]
TKHNAKWRLISQDLWETKIMMLDSMNKHYNVRAFSSTIFLGMKQSFAIARSLGGAVTVNRFAPQYVNILGSTKTNHHLNHDTASPSLEAEKYKNMIAQLRYINNMLYFIRDTIKKEKIECDLIITQSGQAFFALSTQIIIRCICIKYEMHCSYYYLIQEVHNSIAVS